MYIAMANTLNNKYSTNRMFTKRRVKKFVICNPHTWYIISNKQIILQ